MITEEQFAEAILTELLETLIPFPALLEKMQWAEIAKIGKELRRISRNIIGVLDANNIMASEYSMMKISSQIMCLYSPNNSDKQLLGLDDVRIRNFAPTLARHLVDDIEAALNAYFANQAKPVCYTIESGNSIQLHPLTLKFQLSGDNGTLDNILCSPEASCIGIAIAAMNSEEIGTSPESNWVWWPRDSTTYIVGDDTWKHPEIWEET